jgi:CarD family transcriptional regulator
VSTNGDATGSTATGSTATGSTATGSTATGSTATESTEPTESTQPAAVAEPQAAKSRPARRAGAKRPTAGAERTKDAADPANATPPDEPAAIANGTVEADSSQDEGSAAKPASKSTATKRKSTTRSKTRYAVGQQIVYPLQGVGRIERIEDRDFQGKPTRYYVVYLQVSDMTIMIPVDKADVLGIRAIVSKRKAERALRLIAEDFDPIPTDWKLRYQMNLDLLKLGAVDDIASVVRCLSYRSRIKELPILERKLYDSALRLMVDEVSYSLGQDKTEIEKLIDERLENVKQKGDE